MSDDAMERARAARKPAGERKNRTPLEVFQDNPKSRRAAVGAKCWDCQGGGADPGIRAGIRNCTQGPGAKVPCALYAFRPYQ